MPPPPPLPADFEDGGMVGVFGPWPHRTKALLETWAAGVTVKHRLNRSDRVTDGAHLPTDKWQWAVPTRALWRLPCKQCSHVTVEIAPPTARSTIARTLAECNVAVVVADGGLWTGPADRPAVRPQPFVNAPGLFIDAFRDRFIQRCFEQPQQQKHRDGDAGNALAATATEASKASFRALVVVVVDDKRPNGESAMTEADLTVTDRGTKRRLVAYELLRLGKAGAGGRVINSTSAEIDRMIDCCDVVLCPLPLEMAAKATLRRLVRSVRVTACGDGASSTWPPSATGTPTDPLRMAIVANTPDRSCVVVAVLSGTVGPGAFVCMAHLPHAPLVVRDVVPELEYFEHGCGHIRGCLTGTAAAGTRVLVRFYDAPSMQARERLRPGYLLGAWGNRNGAATSSVSVFDQVRLRAPAMAPASFALLAVDVPASRVEPFAQWNRPQPTGRLESPAGPAPSLLWRYGSVPCAVIAMPSHDAAAAFFAKDAEDAAVFGTAVPSDATLVLVAILPAQRGDARPVFDRFVGTRCSFVDGALPGARQYPAASIATWCPGRFGRGLPSTDDGTLARLERYALDEALPVQSMVRAAMVGCDDRGRLPELVFRELMLADHLHRLVADGEWEGRFTQRSGLGEEAAAEHRWHTISHFMRRAGNPSPATPAPAPVAKEEERLTQWAFATLAADMPTVQQWDACLRHVAVSAGALVPRGCARPSKRTIRVAGVQPSAECQTFSFDADRSSIARAVARNFDGAVSRIDRGFGTLISPAVSDELVAAGVDASLRSIRRTLFGPMPFSFFWSEAAAVSLLVTKHRKLPEEYRTFLARHIYANIRKSTGQLSLWLYSGSGDEAQPPIRKDRWVALTCRLWTGAVRPDEVARVAWLSHVVPALVKGLRLPLSVAWRVLQYTVEMKEPQRKGSDTLLVAAATLRRS